MITKKAIIPPSEKKFGGDSFSSDCPQKLKAEGSKDFGLLP